MQGKGLPLADREAPGASLLLNLVRELRIPYGHERSFKVTDGALLDNRYLLSLHKTSLGAEPWATLSPICAALAMPAAYMDPVQDDLGEATIIHLGFEEGTQTRTYKLYLELAANFRRAIETMRTAGVERRQAAPLLVHLAYKWDAENPGKHTVARYTCQPSLPVSEISERLSAIFGKGQGTAHSIARRLLDLAAQRVAEEDIFFLEVEEDNNPRRSFDMKLYDAGLTLRDVDPLLSEIWRHFRIPQESLQRVTALRTSQSLGHLSGGIGRDGGEFFSVYFGVTAH